ncbi:MAG: calcium-binding protein, partial [Paracoccaceae bacterium]
RGVKDWSTQHPFLDLMKTARPWIGHKPGQWGGFTGEDLRAGGYLDAQGWPRDLPEDAQRLEALVLTDQPAEAEGLAGTYVLRWKGEGEVQVAGRSRLVSHRPHEIVFNYTPGEGLVGVRVLSTDPEGTGDHVRDITLVRQEHLALHEAGALFNPDWIDRVADLRAVRFLDWMATNGSEETGWEDRPRVSDATYAWRGVPLEVMLRLANEIGADPWFTLPHKADDDHVRRFARAVRAGLDPRLVAHVEWSNEVWNGIFPQFDWVREQAAARWGDAAGNDAGMQFAGARAAEVMRIWTEVFGDAAPDRLKRVVAVHTGWPGLEEPLLEAPLWVAEEPGRAPPVDWFDAYAVTGYVGYELGRDEWAPRILEWLEEESREAVVTRAAQVIRDGSMQERTGQHWTHHAEVARRHGLELLMYEGGTHVVGHGRWVRDDTLTEFFTHFNYTEEMGAIHRELLDRWRDVGGTLFNAFVDVSGPSQWGSWGALRHLYDETPRWRELMAYNAEAPGWGETRAAGAFLHGVTRFASDAGERLEGTPEEDSLIGGPGDDTLVSHGGADRLHGGPGQDVAVLPGNAADYVFRRNDGAVLAEGPEHVSRLLEVEKILFADDPGLTFLTSSLP